MTTLSLSHLSTPVSYVKDKVILMFVLRFEEFAIYNIVLTRVYVPLLSKKLSCIDKLYLELYQYIKVLAFALRLALICISSCRLYTRSCTFFNFKLPVARSKLPLVPRLGILVA